MLYDTHFLYLTALLPGVCCMHRKVQTRQKQHFVNDMYYVPNKTKKNYFSCLL